LRADGKPRRGYGRKIVGDQLVIVDPNARRVVAIVPNIG
jgi:hypothetical protein